jgi:serine-type D-Ala-D-Ala carboxypeptidase
MSRDAWDAVADRLWEQCPRAFPGAVLGCWKGGRETFLAAAGVTALAGHGVPPAPVHVDTVFDLASLTKPLCTAPVAFALAAAGRLDLDAPLAAVLPRLRGTPWGDVTAVHLLAHTSGLPAWRSFAADLAAARGPAVAGTPEAREAVRARIAAEVPSDPAGAACTYSDLGFLLLQDLCEAAGGRPLDDLFESAVAAPLGLVRTFFVPVAPGGDAGAAPVPTEDLAATEICPTRRRCCHGEVHDDNAWVLGGVAGHAGLFGTAREVARIALALGDCGRGDGRWLPPDLLRRAWSREATPPGSTRVMGFDTPSPAGSMAGDRAPAGTVGHLGFTGTSFWLHPGDGDLVVLLTNRVHPTRANEAIRAARPRIHDACWEALARG